MQHDGAFRLAVSCLVSSRLASCVEWSGVDRTGPLVVHQSDSMTMPATVDRRDERAHDQRQRDTCARAIVRRVSVACRSPHLTSHELWTTVDGRQRRRRRLTDENGRCTNAQQPSTLPTQHKPQSNRARYVHRMVLHRAKAADWREWSVHECTTTNHRRTTNTRTIKEDNICAQVGAVLMCVTPLPPA
jgi:hypothetical protein